MTLRNQTPTPVTLCYEDDFLTLELEKLSVPASRGYDGEYQEKTTFSAGELGTVLGYHGHSLTNVQGFTKILEVAHDISEESKKLDSLTEQSNLNSAGVIFLQQRTDEEAMEAVLKLCRESETTIYYSDIAERLGMELEQVLTVVSKLEDEGLLEGAEHYA